jgi:CRP-like cAMP-binding protein
VPEPFDIATINLPGDSEIHALMAVCPDIEPLRFANDEFIVHGSDTARDVFILLRGNCLVEQPDAPQERKPGNELAILSADPVSPVIVGEMAYLGGGFRSAAVRSVMACFALRLKPEYLDIIMEQFPGFTRVLCRQFAQRLGEANSFIKNFQQASAMEVEQRFLSPGEVLAEAGAPADAMFQIVDGAVIEKGPEDVVIRPGESKPCFVCCREFFAGGVYARRIVAKSPSIVLALGKSRKAAILRNFPELGLSLLEEALAAGEAAGRA